MSLHLNGPIRIVTDPEAKYFESGKSVVSFYAGTSEGKDKNGEYIRNGIDAEAWDKTGQVILDYAPKGSVVYASGNLVKQEWNDKETGAKRSKHIMRINRIELLPSTNKAAAPNSSSAPADPMDDDDEIPF
jgi:single-strand DNA-binding protein